MKKNVMIKGILVLIVIAFLTIGFVGCAPTLTTFTIAPTTGTVYMVVYGWDFYDLYMDWGIEYWGQLSGTYVLYNVSIGSHFFEAYDDWGWTWGYDSVTQYISAGVNYVYLYPY